MQPDIPEIALRFGFVTIPVGIHTGKTILVPELSLLLDAAPSTAGYSDFRRLAIEENTVLKATTSSRETVFRALARLYGLRQGMALFRVFQWLWRESPEERPLLALLLAAARDSALRLCAPAVFGKQTGERVAASDFEALLAAAYDARYSAGTLLSMAQHIGGSWVQSGHLSGRSVKRRARAVGGPATAAYAIWLGYLCGGRGVALFDTFWTRLLDMSPEELDNQAFAAAQRGWLVYRRIGQVAEVRFPPPFDANPDGKER